MLRLFQSIVLAFCFFWIVGCGSLSLAPGSLDADNDGVRNSDDNCPDSTPGLTVSSDGCDLFNGVLDNVVFATSEYSLNLESRDSLDQLIMKLQAHPDVSIAIDAHTDNRGNAKDNLALSKLRVMAVVRYLVVKGVDGSRLYPHGYGESRPLVSNATEEGRARNRRIEVSEKTAN